MMYCPSCGQKMHEAAASCPACGRPNSRPQVPGGDIENTSWFGFRGRISRKEFWLHYALPLGMISFFTGFLDGLLRTTPVLNTVSSLIFLVPSLASSVKRLHDRDKSAWFLLLWRLPVIGWIWILVETGFLQGTDGPNRFGRDPLR